MYAFPGGGANWQRAGALLSSSTGPSRASSSRSASRQDSIVTRWRCSWPAGPRHELKQRADLLIGGRVATLAGDSGFGWQDGLAIANGRVLAAGR